MRCNSVHLPPGFNHHRGTTRHRFLHCSPDFVHVIDYETEHIQKLRQKHYANNIPSSLAIFNGRSSSLVWLLNCCWYGRINYNEESTKTRDIHNHRFIFQIVTQRNEHSSVARSVRVSLYEQFTHLVVKCYKKKKTSKIIILLVSVFVLAAVT